MHILLLVALLPPLYLMHLVYKQDKIEHEPRGLVAKIFLFGALSVIPTLIVELLLDGIIGSFFSEANLTYIIIDNFIGVAMVEEFFKYQAARRIWNNPNFDYRFDAVVYCVAASLGFAALENIEYVFQYGVSTGIMRAVLSIPGHCIFGIFMGIYMGSAKLCEVNGDLWGKKANIRKALLVPILLHGTYDTLATIEDVSFLTILLFFAFVILVDIIAIKRIKKESATDVPLFSSSYNDEDYPYEDEE